MTFAYIGIGIIAWLLILLLAVCLCRSAAEMDRAPRRRR